MILLRPAVSGGPPLIPTMCLPWARAEATWTRLSSGAKTWKGRILARYLRLFSAFFTSGWCRIPLIASLFSQPMSFRLGSKDASSLGVLFSRFDSSTKNLTVSRRSRVPISSGPAPDRTGHARTLMLAILWKASAGACSSSRNMGWGTLDDVDLMSAHFMLSRVLLIISPTDSGVLSSSLAMPSSRDIVSSCSSSPSAPRAAWCPLAACFSPLALRSVSRLRSLTAPL
mmetsp:Transcript_35103/g.86319  ORF Transcript_35103/g.86319 Transcript_35103/m.86319 type:complete len:228 (-) Transcript_35103:31-714(-)